MWSNTLSVVNVQLLAAICFVRLDGQLTNISTVIVNTTTTTSPVPTIVKPGASSATSVLTPNPKRGLLWGPSYPRLSSNDRMFRYLKVALKSLPGHVLVSWDVENQYVRSKSIIYSLLTEYVLDGDCQGTQNPDKQVIPLANQVRSYELSNARSWSSLAITIRGEDTSNNKVDHLTKTIVTHETRPTMAVENLRATSIQSESAQLAWDPPPCDARGGILKHYDVEIIPKGGRRSSRILQTKTADASITGLTAYSEYDVRVRYINEQGEGPWCQPFYLKTTQGAPGPPVIVYNFTYDDISIGLFIGPPTDSNGLLDQYQVKLQGDVFGISQMYTDVNGTEYVIENVKPGTSYMITVRAHNSAGWGPWSRAIRVVTKEAVRPIPLALMQTAASTTCIRFQWAPPVSLDDIVSKYKIRITANDDAKTNFSSIVPRDARQHEQCGLKPYTQYTVGVAVMRDSGHTGQTIARRMWTEGLVPPKPRQPVVLETTATTISLELYPVIFDFGPLTGYEIRILRVYHNHSINLPHPFKLEDHREEEHIPLSFLEPNDKPSSSQISHFRKGLKPNIQPLHARKRRALRASRNESLDVLPAKSGNLRNTRAKIKSFLTKQSAHLTDSTLLYLSWKVRLPFMLPNSPKLQNEIRIVPGNVKSRKKRTHTRKKRSFRNPPGVLWLELMPHEVSERTIVVIGSGKMLRGQPNMPLTPNSEYAIVYVAKSTVVDITKHSYTFADSTAFTKPLNERKSVDMQLYLSILLPILFILFFLMGFFVIRYVIKILGNKDSGVEDKVSRSSSLSKSSISNDYDVKRNLFDDSDDRSSSYDEDGDNDAGKKSAEVDSQFPFRNVNNLETFFNKSNVVGQPRYITTMRDNVLYPSSPERTLPVNSTFNNSTTDFNNNTAERQQKSQCTQQHNATSCDDLLTHRSNGVINCICNISNGCSSSKNDTAVGANFDALPFGLLEFSVAAQHEIPRAKYLKHGDEKDNQSLVNSFAQFFTRNRPLPPSGFTAPIHSEEQGYVGCEKNLFIMKKDGNMADSWPNTSSISNSQGDKLSNVSSYNRPYYPDENTAEISIYEDTDKVNRLVFHLYESILHQRQIDKDGICESENITTFNNQVTTSFCNAFGNYIPRSTRHPIGDDESSSVSMTFERCHVSAETLNDLWRKMNVDDNIDVPPEQVEDKMGTQSIFEEERPSVTFCDKGKKACFQESKPLAASKIFMDQNIISCDHELGVYPMNGNQHLKWAKSKGCVLSMKRSLRTSKVCHDDPNIKHNREKCKQKSVKNSKVTNTNNNSAHKDNISENEDADDIVIDNVLIQENELSSRNKTAGGKKGAYNNNFDELGKNEDGDRIYNETIEDSEDDGEEKDSDDVDDSSTDNDERDRDNVDGRKDFDKSGDKCRGTGGYCSDLYGHDGSGRSSNCAENLDSFGIFNENGDLLFWQRRNIDRDDNNNIKEKSSSCSESETEDVTEICKTRDQGKTNAGLPIVVINEDDHFKDDNAKDNDHEEGRKSSSLTGSQNDIVNSETGVTNISDQDLSPKVKTFTSISPRPSTLKDKGGIKVNLDFNEQEKMFSALQGTNKDNKETSSADSKQVSKRTHRWLNRMKTSNLTLKSRPDIDIRRNPSSNSRKISHTKVYKFFSNEGARSILKVGMNRFGSKTRMKQDSQICSERTDDEPLARGDEFPVGHFKSELEKCKISKRALDQRHGIKINSNMFSKKSAKPLSGENNQKNVDRRNKSGNSNQSPKTVKERSQPSRSREVTEKQVCTSTKKIENRKTASNAKGWLQLLKSKVTTAAPREYRKKDPEPGLCTGVKEFVRDGNGNDSSEGQLYQDNMSQKLLRHHSLWIPSCIKNDVNTNKGELPKMKDNLSTSKTVAHGGSKLKRDYAERGNRQLLSFHDEFRILEKYRNRIMKRMHFESARAHWHKNRSTTILPPDHSRVNVEKVSPQETDYYNAVYHRLNRTYIAAQTPFCPNSVNDFWRMVLQNKVETIVLLCNCVECGIVMCHQYWADSGVFVGAAVLVETLEIHTFADFVIRHLQVSAFGSKETPVAHFQFTTWPINSIPDDPFPLLELRYHVRRIHGSKTTPVLVQCATGVARSAVFIAVDTLIEDYGKDGYMNVFKLVKKMRRAYPFSVRTFKHYLLIYEILFEEFQAGDTVLDKGLRERYRELCQRNPFSGTSYLVDQYRMLEQFTPPLSKEACSDAYKAENRPKNASQSIVPPDLYRPVLNTEAENIPPSGYINAVFVDGLNRRSEFIVSQAPMTNTVCDFWRMIFDYQVQTIVMLGKCKGKNLESYFPKIGSRQFQYINVEHVTTAQAGIVTVRNLKMCVFTLRGVEKTAIRHFHIKSWSEDDSCLESYRLESLPESKADLLTLIDMVMDWQMLANRRTRPIVVVDKDGASISGLFCACALLCERMRMNGEVDLYHTVKHMKRRRPQFVSSFEQYRYLHHVLWEFLNATFYFHKMDPNDDDDDDEDNEEGKGSQGSNSSDLVTDCKAHEDINSRIWSCSAEDSFDDYDRFPVIGEGISVDIVASVDDKTREVKVGENVDGCGVQEVSITNSEVEDPHNYSRDLAEHRCTQKLADSSNKGDIDTTIASISQCISPTDPVGCIVAKRQNMNEFRDGGTLGGKNYDFKFNKLIPFSPSANISVRCARTSKTSCTKKDCSSTYRKDNTTTKCCQRSRGSAMSQGMFQRHSLNSKCKIGSMNDPKKGLHKRCSEGVNDVKLSRIRSIIDTTADVLTQSPTINADIETNHRETKEMPRTLLRLNNAAEMSRRASIVCNTVQQWRNTSLACYLTEIDQTTGMSQKVSLARSTRNVPNKNLKAKNVALINNALHVCDSPFMYTASEIPKKNPLGHDAKDISGKSLSFNNTLESPKKTSLKDKETSLCYDQMRSKDTEKVDLNKDEEYRLFFHELPNESSHQLVKDKQSSQTSNAIKPIRDWKSKRRMSSAKLQVDEYNGLLTKQTGLSMTSPHIESTGSTSEKELFSDRTRDLSLRDNLLHHKISELHRTEEDKSLTLLRCSQFRDNASLRGQMKGTRRIKSDGQRDVSLEGRSVPETSAEIYGMAQTNDPDTGKDQIDDAHGQPTSLHKKHQNTHSTLDIYEALDQGFLDCQWLGTLNRDPVEKSCCSGVSASKFEGFPSQNSTSVTTHGREKDIGKPDAQFQDSVVQQKKKAVNTKRGNISYREMDATGLSYNRSGNIRPSSYTESTVLRNMLGSEIIQSFSGGDPQETITDQRSGSVIANSFTTQRSKLGDKLENCFYESDSKHKVDCDICDSFGACRKRLDACAGQIPFQDGSCCARIQRRPTIQPLGESQLCVSDNGTVFEKEETPLDQEAACGGAMGAQVKFSQNYSDCVERASSTQPPPGIDGGAVLNSLKSKIEKGSHSWAGAKTSLSNSYNNEVGERFEQPSQTQQMKSTSMSSSEYDVVVDTRAVSRKGNVTQWIACRMHHLAGSVPYHT